MKPYVPAQSLQILLLLLLVLSTKTTAQITLIPDSNFEQDLLDQGIDTDGELNGQVFTSDINTIITYESETSILDFTGIEGFANLEILIINGGFSVENLNLSNNIQLRELYIYVGFQNFTQNITTLDLSNNINLEYFYGLNMQSLETLNAKNGNNSILRVNLACKVEDGNCFITNLECVMVDDVEAATNNDLPYTNWSIDSTSYVFSEDCDTLSIPEVTATTIKLYPNPVQEQLFIQSNTPLEKASIYTVTGRLVKEVPLKADTSINVQDLVPGLYFITLKDEEGELLTKKFVKQ